MTVRSAVLVSFLGGMLLGGQPAMRTDGSIPGQPANRAELSNNRVRLAFDAEGRLSELTNLRTGNKYLSKAGYAPWRMSYRSGSSYPAQCSPGIETVTAPDAHIDVLREHVDAELASLSEGDAPGVSAFRQELDRILVGRPRCEVPHEQIIAKLDEAARRFRVLIKTTLTIPYTTVFLELGCGYWTAEAESRLRSAERATKVKTNFL
jgi:hypothetical protein